MSDIVKLLEEAETAEDSLVKKTRARDRAMKKAQEKWAALRNACEAACRGAVKEFNEGEGLRIIFEEHILSFGLEDKTLSFERCRLAYGALQPDGDLDSTDVAGIQRRLKPIVEKHLAAADIPLTFGRFSVPSHYYMK